MLICLCLDMAAFRWLAARGSHMHVFRPLCYLWLPFQTCIERGQTGPNRSYLLLRHLCSMTNLRLCA